MADTNGSGVLEELIALADTPPAVVDGTLTRDELIRRWTVYAARQALERKHGPEYVAPLSDADVLALAAALDLP